MSLLIVPISTSSESRCEEHIMSTAAEDRISSLLDDILIHILSFVPTKQAVTTSILSKRWMHLWRHVPNLDFSDTKLSNLADNYRFNQFVNSILQRQEAAGNHSITTFMVDIEYEDSSELRFTDIEEWVNIVVKRKVQYIHLYTHAPANRKERSKTFPRLPKSILNCTTLVGLMLRQFSVYIDASSLLNLPSLKTLHLKDIYFHQILDFMMFLDGCPVLEDLQLSNIELVSDPHHSFDNFESSSMLRKLNRADITMCFGYIPMKSLSNLEFLRLKLFEDFHRHRYYDFPTFLNLTHLVLNYDWDTVLQVIKHCSKLQNLELYQILQGYEWLGPSKIWVDPEFVPSCLSFNLTTCTMRDFGYAGRQRNHVMLARFILKNARVLETLTIWCHSKQSEIESQSQLFPCPRASATCQLSIFYQDI